MKNIAIIFCTIIFLLISLEGFSTVRLNCPGAIDLGCNPGKIDIPQPNKLEYDTDCKPAKISIVSQISSIDPETCKASLSVTYRAEDKCGDMDECTIVISWIEDVDPPVFDVCPQGNIGCINSAADLDDPIVLGMKISDNCGVLEVHKTFEKIIKTGDCTYQAQQQWEATDQCGNKSSCFTVVSYTLNNNPPIITSCPRDTFLGCWKPNLQIPEPDINEVKWQGGCSANLEPVYNDIYLDSCLSYINRYYIVKDQCGNADTCVQKISWSSDLEGPIFTKYPNNVDLGCNPKVNWNDYDLSKSEVLATDNCGGVTVKYLGQETWEDDCDQGIVYTWEATDNCGNSNKLSKGVSWTIDTIPPQPINCPKDVNLGVLKELPNLDNLYNSIIFLATDNCSYGNIPGVVTGYVDEKAGSKYRRVYTRTATDYCGNSVSCKQTITYILDESAPIITSCPEDRNYGCVGSDFLLPPSNLIELQYEDESNVMVKISPDSIVTKEGCTNVVRRVYNLIDEVGNSSFCDQLLRYTPVNLPNWTYCPPDLDLGCNPDLDSLSIILADHPTAGNGCSHVSVQKLPDFPDTKGCEEFILQVWIGTDGCDNVIRCERLISYTVDTEAPQINYCPPGIDFGCVENFPIIPEFNEADISVSDECYDLIISHKDEEFILPDCSTVIRRYIIVSDGCDNLTVCSQEFKWKLIPGQMEDIPFPQDEIISCNSEIPEPPIYEERECGIGIPQLLDENIGGDVESGNYTLFRYWIKEDCYGNVSSTVQVITAVCEEIGLTRKDVNTRSQEFISSERDKRFKVFPNPGLETINVQMEIAADLPYQVLVTDITGKPIIQKSGSSNGLINEEINAAGFIPGIYLIEIRSVGLRMTKKWIKAH